jgi:hypothetical protein
VLAEATTGETADTPVDTVATTVTMATILDARRRWYDMTCS